jgi:glycosyltransferase involved in cell wall biosynthesis
MLESALAVNVPSAGYPYALLPALAEQLIAAGHRVTIVTLATDIGASLQFAKNQLGLVLVPSRPRERERQLGFYRRERKGLADALKELRPDVIHAQWTYEYALGAAEAAVAPVLVTARDSPLKVLLLEFHISRLFRLLLAYRARFSIRHVSAPSPYLARSLRWFAYFGRIPVIPNLVPAPPAVSEGVVRAPTTTVLCVSNASRLKNVRSLLRAMAQVRTHHPDARLRLVGQGLGPGSQVEAWARHRGLDARVDFVGFADRVALDNEYARAAVFCSPSLEESFGNVLVEALQAGLPVIAGKYSGAVPWVLFDGQAGKLVNVRDPAAIATAISDAINDPSSTVAPGFDVARAIAQRYGPAAVAAAYLAEYQRVIATEAQQLR